LRREATITENINIIPFITITHDLNSVYNHIIPIKNTNTRAH
jgi:hypothetical protein